MLGGTVLTELPAGVEQKYVFVAAFRDELADWMEYALQRDPAHGVGVVNSLYYDTPHLDLYHQKRASEYLKFKVRLRWYGELEWAGAGAEVACFLEVKRKIGSTRRKRRTRIVLDSAVLAGPPDRPELGALAELAPASGYPAHSPLVPMALIRYRRMRFVDPATGARVALDWDIGCSWFNTSVLPLVAPARLDRGVVEVKGVLHALPASLEPVASLLHKASFSKYAQCLEKAMYPEGIRI